MPSGSPKKVSAEEAVQAVQSGDRVVLPLCCGLPQTLVEALVANHERLQNVEIVSGLQIEYKFLEPGLESAFTFRTWQCAPAIRKLLPKGTVKYIPMRQGDAAWMFSRDGVWPVKRALIQTSPPDRNGYMSLGVSISHALPTALEAETVIAEVNEQMPRVLGDCFIHSSQVDYIVESSRPLLEIPPPKAVGDVGKHHSPSDGLVVGMPVPKRLDQVVEDLVGLVSPGYLGLGTVPGMDAVPVDALLLEHGVEGVDKAPGGFEVLHAQVF